MKTGQYIRILAEFVTGEISFSEFKQLIEERIFDLCQKPEITDEKRALSSIELYLHEAAEGLRDESEVYAHVQFTLDSIILSKLTSPWEYFSPSSPKLTYLLSKTFDVDPEQPQPILSLAATK